MTSAQSAALRTALPIGILASAVFLSSIGSRIIDPLLSVLADDFHTSIPAVSVVVAAFTLPYGLCQIIIGPIGDRVGKLRVMLVALLGYCLATAGCAFSTGLPMLTLLRVAAGASSAGLIPVGLAYIGDAVPYADRQVALGRFLNGAVLAQVLAGPLGGIFGQYIGWRGVFLLLSACALVAAAVLGGRLGTLHDPPADNHFKAGNYLVLARRPFARRLLLCGTLDGFLLVGCFPFLAPYMASQFGLTDFAVGLVLACFGLGAWLYIRQAKRLVPTLRESGMVLAGSVLMATALSLGMLSSHWLAFLAVEFVLGFGFFMMHSVLLAGATEILPGARATAVASFAFMMFMGQSLGALTMGGLIATIGYRQAFRLDASGILLLGVLLWVLLRNRAQ